MFASAVLFVLAVLLFLLLFPIHRSKNFPPGPRAFPILGNLLELNLESPIADFEKLAKRYGNVYSLFIGPRPVVVLNGLQAMKEALVNKAADFSGRPQDLMVNHAVIVKAHAPGVVLADYNPAWKEQRRFGLMTLRNFGLGKHSMEQNILGQTRRIIKVLEQSVDLLSSLFFVLQGTTIIPNLSSVLSEEGQWKSPHEFDPENFLNEKGEFVKPEAFMPFSTDLLSSLFFVLQGTTIIPNLSSVLSEEGQWKSPHEFDPENFLNEKGEFVKPEAFMPFSTGNHDNPQSVLGAV
ncbi:Cytochrome P450 2D10 [Larimichthys crocea]|uniref:Uncharacterized protein n=1 Tax=Larimichthys crocea TaxID=215358 RepID=A0ACD3QFN8_LARCR|nr:Cytochrome P450 2D10 [Larimichthys crocea]